MQKGLRCQAGGRALGCASILCTPASVVWNVMAQEHLCVLLRNFPQLSSLKNVKLTEKLKAENNYYLNTLHLDSPIINILPHLLIFWGGVIHAPSPLNTLYVSPKDILLHKQHLILYPRNLTLIECRNLT